MTEESKEQQTFSELSYCPICGLLAIGEERHICPEYILDEICKVEEAKSEEFDNDDDKSYGERLDDAEFMFNYYDEDDDTDEDNNY